MTPADPRPSTSQAITRYWRHLLGLVFFPPIAFTATKLVELPPDVMAFAVAVLFFASCLPVGWLLLSNKVRYSFWLAAIGIYFAAGMATSLVYHAVRAMGL
jgi:hypothetical protein